MNDSEVKELKQVREFLNGSASVKFNVLDKREAYAWIAGALKRFDYYSPAGWAKRAFFASMPTRILPLCVGTENVPTLPGSPASGSFVD